MFPQNWKIQLLNVAFAQDRGFLLNKDSTVPSIFIDCSSSTLVRNSHHFNAGGQAQGHVTKSANMMDDSGEATFVLALTSGSMLLVKMPPRHTNSKTWNIAVSNEDSEFNECQLCFLCRTCYWAGVEERVNDAATLYWTRSFASQVIHTVFKWCNWTIFHWEQLSFSQRRAFEVGREHLQCCRAWVSLRWRHLRTESRLEASYLVNWGSNSYTPSLKWFNKMLYCCYYCR